MSAFALLGALAGLLVASGILTCLSGLRPAPVRADPRPRRRGRGGGSGRGTWDRWRWTVAGTAGLLAWLLSGWPIAGLIVAITTLGLPVLLSTSRVASRGIARIEAVEEWTRRLSDILVVGIGLEQAITTSLRSVPEAIRTEVTALAARLGARWPTETALRAFADDLGDATGDLVVASLILGHRRRGPGLARALTAVADSVAEEVAMRRRVEADRAKPRATARAVTLITLGVVAVGALNRTYLAPYGTPLGQLVLLGVAGIFVGALAWMRALTLSAPQPRLISNGSRPERTGR
jgi:tight adherence protein B